MSKAVVRSLAVLVLFAGSVSPGFSQAISGDAAASLQKELSQLNQSMAQLVALLRQNLETQQTEVLLKRVELSRLDLTPLENELRSLRASRDGLQEERDRVQARLDEVEAQQASRREEIPERANEELRMMMREAEAQIKLMKDRLRGLELRIVELEGDVASKRREIEVLEAAIDERLRLRR
jgi:chromosome segregation protein